jgi:hypothetical protein
VPQSAAAAFLPRAALGVSKATQKQFPAPVDCSTDSRALQFQPIAGWIRVWGACCGRPPEPVIIYFGCVDMRTPRPQQKRTTQEHDFSRDKDRCARCGMHRRVWVDTHVPCPRRPYTLTKPSRILARRDAPGLVSAQARLTRAAIDGDLETRASNLHRCPVSSRGSCIWPASQNCVL